jgi:hypothetical protein
MAQSYSRQHIFKTEQSQTEFLLLETQHLHLPVRTETEQDKTRHIALTVTSCDSSLLKVPTEKAQTHSRRRIATCAGATLKHSKRLTKSPKRWCPIDNCTLVKTILYYHTLYTLPANLGLLDHQDGRPTGGTLLPQLALLQNNQNTEANFTSSFSRCQLPVTL